MGSNTVGDSLAADGSSFCREKHFHPVGERSQTTLQNVPSRHQHTRRAGEELHRRKVHDRKAIGDIWAQMVKEELVLKCPFPLSEEEKWEKLG